MFSSLVTLFISHSLSDAILNIRFHGIVKIQPPGWTLAFKDLSLNTGILHNP